MTDAKARQVVIHFVEGRISAEEFQRVLHDDRILEAFLSDDPDLPPEGYIRSSTHQFLLKQDYDDPGGILNAQGALSQWLERHGIAHARDGSAEELYDLLADPLETRNLAADPEYLEIQAASSKRTDDLRAAYGGPYTPVGQRRP